MATVFSELVAAPEWRTQADSWIGERLSEGGVRVIGEIVQPRIRPWSTQLVVPTDAGTVWFKANCPELAFEPPLHRALSRLVPDEVDEPIAIDAERGWMMTRDRGITLSERHEATLVDWQAVVRRAAELQRLVASEGAPLLATGLPDCAPGTILDRFDGLLELYAGLPPGHPCHLPAERVRELAAVRPRLAEAVDVLESGPLPATFQHGDLHPGNVFAVDGGLRIFDFGDAQWAAAPEILCVPYGWLAGSEIPWAEVLAAYHEVWSDVVSHPELDVLLAAAVMTQPVNRSMTWWSASQGATAEEWAQFGDAAIRHLGHVLEPWP